jgi:hypothetical protein
MCQQHSALGLGVLAVRGAPRVSLPGECLLVIPLCFDRRHGSTFRSFLSQGRLGKLDGARYMCNRWFTPF